MASHLISVARRVSGLLLCLLPYGAAQALIDISPKILEMKDEQAVVQVINTGDTPEFVDVALFEIDNPGVPIDEEQLIPLGISKDPYLYAAPFKLSLGPRQQKTVQLTALKPPGREKVYRLAVIPQQRASVSGTQDNVMLVSLGFNGLVRQLPIKQVATWQHRCQASGLLLEANGTVRVEFSELKLDGQAMDDFNVYPGTPRQMVGNTLSGKAQDKSFSLQCSK
ncbi:fimbrial biogenesis chaperone [Serratia aquatilis]|uniref:Molecular chaperone n=1 Tax=Serratia aquatilis TaxID=1737515 RepID=A0ABV6EEP4_9GAMM